MTNVSYTDRYGWFCVDSNNDSDNNDNQQTDYKLYSTMRMRTNKYSLIDDVKKHLIDLLKKINNNNSKWKRLVLDDMMFYQFEVLFTKDVLMDLNISMINNLNEYSSVCVDTKNTLDTIYMIHYDDSSIYYTQCLNLIKQSIDPFTVVMNYVCIPSNILDTSLYYIPKIFGRSLCGIYRMDYGFCVIDKDIFSLELPESIKTLFIQQIDNSQRTVGQVPESILDNVVSSSMICKNIGYRIASIFNMMGHYPVIFSSKTLVSINTAKVVDEALKNILYGQQKNNDGKVKDNDSHICPRITLIIMDRSIDPLLPLLQCSSVEGLFASTKTDQYKNRIDNMSTNERKIFSKLWENVKNLDISTAHNKLAAITQTFIESQRQIKGDFTQKQKTHMNPNIITNSLINAISVPHYIKSHSILIDAFTEKHKIAINDKLYDDIELENILMMIIYPEQDIDNVAKDFDLDDVINQVDRCVMKLANDEKRIKMIILLNKILQKHCSKTFRDTQIINMLKRHNLNNNKYVSVIKSIDNVCNPVDENSNSLNDSRRILTDKLKKSTHKRDPIIDPLKNVLSMMDMNKYRSKLFDIIMSYNLDTIDEDDYFCQINDQSIDPIKGRSMRHITHMNRNGDIRKNHHNMRLFVFVLGGMTYHEMRLSCLISNFTRTNLVIGSTHILTPELYVRQLASLY